MATRYDYEITGRNAKQGKFWTSEDIVMSTTTLIDARNKAKRMRQEGLIDVYIARRTRNNWGEAYTYIE